MTTAALAGALLLADDESKKSGPIGLAVILVLCVACYFLFKSLSKHLRKVREQFPADPPEAADPLGPSTPAPASGPSTSAAPGPETAADEPPSRT